ncbi:ComEC/Rec2 family competence protein [Salinimicrobium xinjiangense]|uniref:ComEC/Rec2 family competence protein n=1 Tax=Salinimicrobium xinjiangense TaxID=438596 RepID=UPI00048FB5FC|nr:ComEC/Rec2 family competence protein [Salinimicrobium xinjiangense]
MNTAVIRISLVLLIGIISGFRLELPLKIAFLSLLAGLILFFISFIRAKKLIFPDAFFGSSTFLLFFLLGIFSTSLHLPKNQPNHYLNKVSSEPQLLKLRVKESLKSDLYNHKFVAEVLLAGQQQTHGKILLLQPKDSLRSPFLEGQKIIIAATPEAIPSPLNPHQFDYSQFMARKDIYRQVNLRQGIYQVLPSEIIGIKIAAANLRREITAALQQKRFGKEELAVVQALLLGQKQDISAETYNNFAAAGAIHILAVSGLHVGIILLILNRLFAPLRRLKNGSFLKTFLVIIFLWGFAVLAGLSPSVVRAVTMFSFIAVGLEIKRRTGTLNSVFLSLLLLILIRPQWIFEVGFQLSYSAVIAIVLFQPLLSGLYQPSTRAGKYFWGLFTVTLAAQIGVLPLSLYYFHQFPGLFFLTNLLILPFLGVILLFGVLVIILALLDILPAFVVNTYELIIEILNSIVGVIARQEQFLFKDIPFSIAEVLGWYLLILVLYWLWKYFSYKKLLLGLASILVLQFIYISQAFKNEDELIIFHRGRNTLIGKTEKDQLNLYHKMDGAAGEVSIIQNYKVGESIARIEEKPLQNIYSHEDQFLILTDSSGILPAVVPSNFHLLLSGSPRINLERVLEQVKPAAVIADGNNYRSLVARWEETTRKSGIRFHYTGKDGAYIIR